MEAFSSESYWDKGTDLRRGCLAGALLFDPVSLAGENLLSSAYLHSSFIEGEIFTLMSAFHAFCLPDPPSILREGET